MRDFINNLSRQLKKLIPPGDSLRQEITGYVTMMVFFTGYSFRFLIQYLQAREELFTWVSGRKILISQSLIKPLDNILEGSMRGIWLLMLYCLLMCLWHYLHFHQDSKSIYLMKRLPDRFELVKRCMALPAIEIVLTLIWAALLLGIYSLIYYSATPYQCLPAENVLHLRNLF